MAPSSSTRRLLQLLSWPRAKLRLLRHHPAWRWIWRFFTALSLLAVAIAVYYAFNEFPTEGLQFRPAFLILAGAIYLLTFAMHLLGWHNLSQLLLGPLPFRQNVEAVAASNLVKYLPTIAWYIANRAHYYGQLGIPQTKVVAASLYELGFMLGACASLLALSWLSGLSPLLAAFVLALIGLLVLLGMRTRTLAIRHWLQPRLIVAFLWYAATWPLAALFLWAVLAAFVPLTLAELTVVLQIWLTASLASYAVSLTLGMLGIAREITLTLLLTQIWSLPVALASAITVKLLLTLGEVVSSLIILGILRLNPTRTRDE
jgi:hypothetical protein